MTTLVEVLAAMTDHVIRVTPKGFRLGTEPIDEALVVDLRSQGLVSEIDRDGEVRLVLNQRGRELLMAEREAA